MFAAMVDHLVLPHPHELSTRAILIAPRGTHPVAQSSECYSRLDCAIATAEKADFKATPQRRIALQHVVVTQEFELASSGVVACERALRHAQLLFTIY